MKLFTTIRQHLGWKLCLSYLLVILAVVLVLDTTAEFRVPTVLRRDVARFPALWRHDPALLAALHASFQAAVDELLVIGSAAALLVAVALSIFTSRRIVRPIRAMVQASQRIAGGDYRHRIGVQDRGARRGRAGCPGASLQPHERGPGAHRAAPAGGYRRPGARAADPAQ